MDQAIRNQLQRATQDVRSLLEHEFAEQLEGTFDILPDGTIQPNPGKHLDDRERLIRRKLVDAIEHIKAGGKKPAEAVDEYTRETAFTFLNRFVALKMLEARSLMQQCVSKGDQSSGLKEFSGLAPGMSELPDDGYRLYLECLFDELSIEVKVLFDRRDPASLLWPRRQALTRLLAILNQSDLASVWDQDETIGWVYQYFNSDADRKKARYDDKGRPRPPQNGYDLAVRNQFFTSRYVVEFLTDNTLGRIWYEMRQGDTQLVERCSYLVRRPTEVFLKEDEESPEQKADEDLSQEGLLLQPVYIPFRATKDPRDLKILDPACGSGHFLLYCFDLLLTIYEEAWHDHDCPPPKDVPEPNLGTPARQLREDYRTIRALRKAVPGLILRHNLHGIDIDARCAQIAAFALWMRAQRAYNEFGFDRASRPAIRKTNIAIAEPMPGETDLLKEFTSTLQPPLLGQLVEVIFEKMLLAGEAGSLLKIEEELRDAIAKAREQWAHGPQAEQMSLFAAERPKADQLRFDLSGITDDRFWQEAEAQTTAALRQFSEARADGTAFRRSLFADDASRGFAFIDLCRQEYDVALMNPPFGEATTAVYELQQRQYNGAHGDLFASFVRRSTSLLGKHGRLGAITSRAFLLAPRMSAFRETDFLPFVDVLADLGLGVMDEAFVEACAFILAPSITDDCFWVCDALRCDNKATALSQCGVAGGEQWLAVMRRTFLKLPGSAIIYRIPSESIASLASLPTFEPVAGTAREGMRTFADERFVRLAWEVHPDDIGVERRWRRYAKGGEFALYWGDLPLLVPGGRNAAEMDAVNQLTNGSFSQVRQASTYWYKPGATYSRRSAKGFSARVLPAEFVISDRGPAVLGSSDVSAYYILGWLNSRLIRSLIHLKASASLFTSGILKSLPWKAPTVSVETAVISLATSVITKLASLRARSETDPYFQPRFGTLPIVGAVEKLMVQDDALLEEVQSAQIEMSSLVDGLYGIDSSPLAQYAFGETQVPELFNDKDRHGSAPALASDALHLALGYAFRRWYAHDACSRDWGDPFQALPNPATSVKASGADSSLLFLHDDDGHGNDIVTSVRAVFAEAYPSAIDAEKELVEFAEGDGDDLRAWFREHCFGQHTQRYSSGRRCAPIYWQLATSSASYSIWLYYHRFTSDTFYKLLNDYSKPKFDHEQRKLDRLRADAGAEPTRSQRGEIDQQETFVAELKTFAEEIERIAPLWNPDLNDGVIINFAPLWRLVPQHKAWQKECKACWGKLVKGDYDWAHLAMHLWPERVVPKCRTDASLAIAHGLEDVFWQQNEKGKWIANDEPDEGWDAVIEQLVVERTKPAVKAALKSLLEAPAPAGNGKRRKRTTRRRTKAK